jgi:phenylacetate-CoA ligase
MLASIQGRTAELLVFANGRSITGPALTLVFRQMAIRGWQVVQTSPRDVEVRIRSERELSEIDAQYILKVFAEHAGSDVTVTIKRVDELQKTKEGKLKPIWVDFAAS